MEKNRDWYAINLISNLLNEATREIWKLQKRLNILLSHFLILIFLYFLHCLIYRVFFFNQIVLSQYIIMF